MLENLNKFERYIYYALMIMLAGVILFGVLELAFIIVAAFFTDTVFRLSHHEILHIFGYFLLILIGIELLETIKAYLIKNEIQVEIIILVAIIAVARKIILLDPFLEGAEAFQAPEIIALGGVIIALAASYYLIKKRSEGA